ncbi:unknown [Haloarcula marismortui ATCC 43049]|uniref:Uncharacterized protein n=2 Tax=Haloarcula marismortui TaxID=2238 RepID=Q5UWT6_HALMA|nr:unknown [Haloarcula marismortui ATCC 43049]EMA07833.1 hypothetical protein C436_21140 [Haloarcula sinaiiensis ATCC 33800]
MDLDRPAEGARYHVKTSERALAYVHRHSSHRQA